MREQKQNSNDKTTKQEASFGNLEKGISIIASVKTGLSSKDDAIIRRLPSDYSGKNVKEVLDYVVNSELSDEEAVFADSIKKEFSSEGRLVVINGIKSNLNDPIKKYLVEKEHKLPDGSKRKYQQLEMEVSAVQRGGFYRFA